MKPQHWNRTSPDGPWDTVVIGSGMGGMTTAGLLSEVGHRVLVLEQHTVPGGFTHTFSRKGWTWDVGVHAVAEVTEHTLSGRLLDKLSRGRLQWASLGSVYEEFSYPDDFRIDFPDSLGEFRDNLVTAFPGEAAAVDQYLARVKETAAATRGYFLSRLLGRRSGALAERLMARRARRSFYERTADVVGRLTDDPRLRSLMTAQWGYYGSVPSRSAFAIQALVVKHFAHGAYYPVGGSGTIAKGLLATVAEHGGWTRIRADVQEIVIESGRAVGVRLPGGEEIRAKRIVSAAGVPSTIRRLLPERFARTRWARELLQLSPSPPHLCLHLGFEGDIRQDGCSGANKWFYETWDCEDDFWHVRPGQAEQPRAQVLYCSFPSLKDPEHDPGPRCKHTGEVVTFVPWETFAPWRQTRWKKRGEDYAAFKEQLTERLLEQFLERIPGLRDKVKYAELSTPLSTDHFCRPTRGAIYGIEPTVERYRNPWLRPRSPIPGLWFSGSDVASVGVMGAMGGGQLCALAIEPIQVLRYLRALA
jgi:all-trans-retinol 13,14-reductase